jgi:hypothetical protein
MEKEFKRQEEENRFVMDEFTKKNLEAEELGK